MNKALNAAGISKTYKSGGDKVSALKKCDFSVNSGDKVAIIGKSGSGKSTLLNVIGGLCPPDTGEVTVAEKSVYKIGETERAALRTRKIGFIYQSFNLIDELSVINNIRLPFDIARIPYDKKLEEELIDRLGIGHRLSFYPQQLSGGERQRVAIVRALLMKPDIILADEPTGNLDAKSGSEVMNFVRESNQTYIIVTHDMEWTKLATVVYKMSDGVMTL